MAFVSTPTASVAVLSADAGLADRIRRILADELTQVAHLTLCAAGGENAMAERPDVVVLDAGAGRSVDAQIRRMRRRWPTIEIVVVNASGERDVEALLDAGADDVIAAGSPVLASRLHARTRRARTVNAGARIAVGDVVFDRESRRVWCAGREVEMTRREHALLDCLFWYAPEPVGMATIADYVWGDGPAESRRGLIEVYVGYLRRKLTASKSAVIRTVRGVGYQFSPR